MRRITHFSSFEMDVIWVSASKPEDGMLLFERTDS